MLKIDQMSPRDGVRRKEQQVQAQKALLVTPGQKQNPKVIC